MVKTGYHFLIWMSSTMEYLQCAPTSLPLPPLPTVPAKRRLRSSQAAILKYQNHDHSRYFTTIARFAFCLPRRKSCLRSALNRTFTNRRPVFGMWEHEICFSPHPSPQPWHQNFPWHVSGRRDSWTALVDLGEIQAFIQTLMLRVQLEAFSQREWEHCSTLL